ncbi:MAG: monovalent cation/H+ antiporter subunit D [Thiohalocapsa sp.]|jgi:multicomponent K+:H+ antiporter subunit D|uniref:proton-conducting transporter transmembrane domain-containing protein n=1 Tax=Thiohalocapsa sp. TaxID=2497641 RepID=UPI0025F7E7B5|nr:proton-conducting transporter membrane subunit [Thiohalocapsa sp.]MCG6943409.1 monovalent cation/H+ antiporter subunit D [Thiohalocapsa sp.]
MTLAQAALPVPALAPALATALALLLPLGLGALLTAWPRPSLRLRRGLGIGGTLGLAGLALWLLWRALAGRPAAVAAGGWPMPYGIVLVADALAALMLLLAALLALAALAHAAATDGDRPARGFHALFQFQLFGVAGALLAGDLFNLFVFFEVLLLASYGLLLQGPRRCPPRVALHYVLLNLVGSTVFLLAVALVYAATGTLNMSQLAARLGALAGPDLALAGAGLLLLATVLGLKAALLPLLAWLPRTYAAAPTPVAALFTLLTKVGIYGLVRLWTIADGTLAGDLPKRTALAHAGLADNPAHPVARLLGPLLLAAALGTLVAGCIGLLAARDLRRRVAWLVPLSVGTTLAGIAAGGVFGLGAALYYLVQSTLIMAGLFLLLDLLPAVASSCTGTSPGAPAARPAPALGVLFLLAAVGVAGMPPLSGFIGKALVLKAVLPDAPGGVASGLWGWIWTAVLGSGLTLTLVLTRTGIQLFWWPRGRRLPVQAAVPARMLLPALALIGAGPLLMVCAGPATRVTAAVAEQARGGDAYAAAVQGLAADRSSAPWPGRGPEAGDAPRQGQTP